MMKFVGHVAIVYPCIPLITPKPQEKVIVLIWPCIGRISLVATTILDNHIDCLNVSLVVRDAVLGWGRLHRWSCGSVDEQSSASSKGCRTKS